MIGPACRHEHDVQRAAMAGRWTNDLRRHVAACATCGDVARITAVLSGDATASPRRVSPSILWAKARHARRRRAEALASRILVSGQVCSGVIGLVVLAYAGTAVDGWSTFGASLGKALPVPELLGGIALLAMMGAATARLITRQS
jgi:hypothetical protein